MKTVQDTEHLVQQYREFNQTEIRSYALNIFTQTSNVGSQFF